MKISNMCSALATHKILISKNLKIHVILMLYGCSCNPSSKRHYDSLRNVSHLRWFLEISVGVSHSTPHPQGTEALHKLGGLH